MFWDDEYVLYVYTSTFRLSVANLFPFHAAAKAYQYSKAIFKKRDQNINLLRQNIEPSFSEAKLGRKSDEVCVTKVYI